MLILHVFDHSIPLHSGYTFRSRAILEQQRALGWDTEHVTGPKQGDSRLLEEQVGGLRFYRSGALGPLTSRVPVWNQMAVVKRLTRRLEAVARAHRPDILHAHSPALDGLAAIRVGRRLGIPVVYEVRAFWEDAAVDHGTSSENGLRYGLSRRLETYVLRNADAVTTICEGLRNDIVERGIPAHKVTVVPNAVDPKRFHAGSGAGPALARSLGLEGQTVLGFIGSFYAYEGLPLALQALAKIQTRQPGVKLLLVGGGPQEDVLRGLVAEYGLEGKVVFTGRVPHDQVQRYYDLVDVFVYPRLPMRLTDLVTPLKPLEAMASQRLVVASDVGGQRELIRDRETGYLFSAGDAGALADTVLELLAARERWPELRRNGRQYIEKERTWPSVVARYGPVYARLMRGEGRRKKDEG